MISRLSWKLKALRLLLSNLICYQKSKFRTRSVRQYRPGSFVFLRSFSAHIQALPQTIIYLTDLCKHDLSGEFGLAELLQKFDKLEKFWLTLFSVCSNMDSALLWCGMRI